jgi:hypothetical protein
MTGRAERSQIAREVMTGGWDGADWDSLPLAEVERAARDGNADARDALRFAAGAL